MEHTNDKIHPTLRISILAWLLTRLVLYVCYFFKLGSLNAILLQLSDEIGKSVPSTFMLNWIRNFFYFMNVTYPNSGTWTSFVLGELLMLAGVMGVYTYARSVALPQVAERATWLWAASPLIFLTLPGVPWQFTIPLIALAYGFTVRRHHFIATVAASTAIFISPEAILAAPLLIAEGWHSREKNDEQGPIAMTIGLPLSFVVTIFSTILLGDGVKAFQGRADWRNDWSFDAFSHFITTPSLDWIAVALVISSIFLSIRLTTRLPKRSFLIFGAILYPLFCFPSIFAVGTVAFALPIFVALAHYTEDREYERPVLFLSLLIFILIMFFI